MTQINEKMEKTTFTSRTSFQDAMFQAKMAGYFPIGQARNPRGEFVVFARKKKF